MMLSKKLLLGIASLSLSTAIFAQDFSDWGMEEESSAEPAVTIGGQVEIAGRVYVDQRDSKDERYSVDEYKTEAIPSGKLNFGYSGPNTDLDLKLKFDKNSLTEYKWDMLDEFTARAYIGNAQLEAGKMRVVWGKGDKIHVLDNFNANDYTDYIIPDYIDRRISEPMLRFVYSTNSNVKFEGIWTPVMTPDRLADNGVWQPKAAKLLKDNISTTAKGVYQKQVEAAEKARMDVIESSTLKQLALKDDALAKDILTEKINKAKDDKLISVSKEDLVKYCTEKGIDPSTLANSSVQEQIGSAVLSEKYSEYITAVYKNALTAQTYGLMNLSSLNSDSSSLYPDTYQLKYGQAGLRTTFTLGGCDLGFSYYYGHFKQPSFNVEKFTKAMVAGNDFTNLSEDDKFLAYNKLQVFGFEAAGIVFGRLNSRMEFAYNLTDDMDGDDPSVQNNSIAWVAGFDLDLPIHNINFNAQTQGKYILKGDKINDSIYKSVDVDADPNDCYTNNKIIVDITDSWNHEKVKLDLKGIYGIERKDLIVMPTLTFVVKDDLTLNLSGMYIWCNNEESEFDGWERNSFAQIGIKYQF